MTMLSDVKMSMRITTNALDSELNILINAALADLGICGVEGDTVNNASTDPLVIRAVTTYCRANFGQPDDYERMKASYDEQKAQLKVATGYTNWGGAAE